MKIWVTGASGFLGRRLSTALVEAGHEVTGLSRRRPVAEFPSVQIDLSSDAAKDEIRNLCRDQGGPDVVVHAACQKPGLDGFSDYVKCNVLTTTNLLESLDPLPRLVIYPSTLSVYGRSDEQPVKETQPTKADFPYALTKRWAETIISKFEAPTQVVILRLPTLYGAGQHDSFVDGLARLALSGQEIELFGFGKTVRDALYVQDAVQAVLQCIAAPPGARFACFNLGCGQRLTTEDYARALVMALKSGSRIVAVDRPSPQPFDLYADISAAQRWIGFQPSALSTSMERYAIELRAQS